MERNGNADKRNISSDRKRVAGGQEHEVRYLAETLNCSEAEVEAAIQAVGNSRIKIQQYLKKELRGRN